MSLLKLKLLQELSTRKEVKNVFCLRNFSAKDARRKTFPSLFAEQTKVRKIKAESFPEEKGSVSEKDLPNQINEKVFSAPRHSQPIQIFP